MPERLSDIRPGQVVSLAAPILRQEPVVVSICNSTNSSGDVNDN